jgi:parallel beta-helix repeat protein
MNTDENTVLNGFTIEDFGGNWTDGDDGDRGQGHPNGEDGVPAEGAGIYIEAGAGPVIKNCIIRDNYITAGDGGTGVNADQNNNAGRGGWGGWAHGAGIYCGPYTNPKLINCTIEGNIAQGGNGGNGGDYAQPGGVANYGGNYSREGSTLNPVYYYSSNGISSEEMTEGHLWQVWEWDWAASYGPVYGQLTLTSYLNDYRWYSAYGGGVYCDVGSEVTFEHCQISGNRTYGGMSGQGGVRGPSGRQQEPLVPYELPSYGAGVYVAADSTATFDGCTFEDNVASETIVDPNHRLSPYIGYGGGVSAENSALVTFFDCNFVDNAADSGGAIFTNQVDVTIVDCNIVSNNALRGGGFLGNGASVDIRKTIVANNQTLTDVNDPNDDEVLSIGAGLCILSADSIVQDCNISGNRAGGSGGGIYLRGANVSSIRNCLVINNSAGRDGGGISTNWYTLTTIANCTFSGNAASGAAGEVGNTGLGGALYCGYQSEATVTDSILWNNFGLKGQEIAVGSGFELDPKCGRVDVFYSNVKLSPNNVWTDVDCELSLEPSHGNISNDPIFVSGPNGRYYLGHAIAGNLIDSPCIDSGSDYASHVGLLGYTTRTDHIRDIDMVDMGYHYNTEDKCRLADFVFDGVIDELDLDKFATLIGFDNFTKLAEEYWLNESPKKLYLPSSAADNWLNGADITTDGHVGGIDDGNDVAFLLGCYKVEDINAPDPNPSEWDIEPDMRTSTSVSMVAEVASDAWGSEVEYYFDCVTPGGHDSGWQRSPLYTDIGLIAGQGYGYRVRARDGSPRIPDDGTGERGNKTEWSEIRYAGIDTIPPAPPPRIETMDANSPTSITMTATPAYDNSGVEYYFEGDANDSGWQTDPNYTVTGLDPNTEYGYRVRARDLFGNMTEWSDTVFAMTPVPPDIDPPDPDPMEWDLVADANGIDGTPRLVHHGGNSFDWWAEMRAFVAVDAGGGPVEYYFQCLDEDDFDSNWTPNPEYIVLLGGEHLHYTFRVKARDQFGNETDWSIPDIAD